MPDSVLCICCPKVQWPRLRRGSAHLGSSGRWVSPGPPLLCAPNGPALPSTCTLQDLRPSPFFQRPVTGSQPLLKPPLALLPPLGAPLAGGCCTADWGGWKGWVAYGLQSCCPPEGLEPGFREGHAAQGHSLADPQGVAGRGFQGFAPIPPGTRQCWCSALPGLQRALTCQAAPPLPHQHLHNTPNPHRWGTMRNNRHLGTSRARKVGLDRGTEHTHTHTHTAIPPIERSVQDRFGCAVQNGVTE